MKPAIFTDPDDSRFSWLVDIHSRNTLHEVTTGKLLVHYETAVNLQNLLPSQYGFNLYPSKLDQDSDFEPSPFDLNMSQGWDLGFVCPYPSVYAIVNNHKVDEFSMGCAKGIYLPAACVMLELTEAFNNVSSCRITKRFSFNAARIERPEAMPKSSNFIPWDPWKFHTAWHWSHWHLQGLKAGKRVTLQARWEKMQAAGYPHGKKAFERMHRELFPKTTD